MFDLIKHKRIFVLLVATTIIGTLLTNGLSSVPRAQAVSFDDVITKIDDVTKGVPGALMTTINPFTGGPIGAIKSSVKLFQGKEEGPSCAWWTMLSDPIPTIIKCVFNPLIGGVARFFGKLIQWTLDINSQLFTNNPYIKNGWTATRDVANLGFVLIIVIIAFATILRFESYGVKKVLTKLIIVALLVNFSLMICAAFFSLSEVFTQYFLKNGFQGNPGDNIASALGLTTDRTLSLVEEGFELTAALIFGLILLVIISITLAAIVIMLLIRYVVLGILVILSPLAWLCSILPKTENLWKKWWTEFIKWIIFAPLMLFFVWLAMFSPSTSTSSDIGAVAGVGNLFIMTGLLLGGLMIANSLGITGAKQFNKWATAGAAGIGGFVGTRLANRALQGGIAQNIVSGFRDKEGKRQGGLQAIGAGQNALLRTVAAPFRKAGFGAAALQVKTSKGLVEKAEKRIEGYNGMQEKIIEKSGTSEEKMALFNKRLKNDKVGEYSGEGAESARAISGKFGEQEKVEKTIDKILPHFNKEVQQAIKDNRPDDAKNKYNELLSKLSEGDWQKVGVSSLLENSKTTETFMPTLIEHFNQNTKVLSSIATKLDPNDRRKFKDSITNTTSVKVNGKVSIANENFINLLDKAKKNLYFQQIVEDHINKI